ncbi:hypothetical protein QN277_025016 [Acacia crassicarpa]|uniref:BZIP domain-containing protein n=1 Tax=Acacia crassicarpa TaxID=499986 RepID=A0AAE1JDA5_9FABA|nr:hypothetical protein QN277_025016 [Acacia crassicarpa]
MTHDFISKSHKRERDMSVQLKDPVFSASSSSSPSSWNHRHNNNNHTFPLHKSSKIEDSDEDLFRVPDMEAAAAGGGEGGGGGAVVSNGNEKAAASLSNVTATATDSQFQSGKRRRGRNPADKECRRLKRLLRNRVSAQQARERKKVYVNELEGRAKELEDKNSKLKERISTLINENAMLRKVLMNTRPKIDESGELKQDQLSKS